MKEEGCPYRDLYIYAVEGRVPACEEAALGSDFIGNWVEGESSFLFFSESADTRVERLVTRRHELTLIERYQFGYPEWQGEGFDLIRAGGVTFRPPWVKSVDGDGGTVLLDPGVVFGNGVHPTTRHCLSALDALRSAFPFRRVLDLGTGTGILSLFAAALGAERVVAVDLNPLCVRTANKNVELNGFSNVIQVVEGLAEDYCSRHFDVVVANIHAEVIKRMLQIDEFVMSPVLVISGLMRTPFRETREQIVSAGYEIWRIYDYEMTWYTLVGVRKTS